MNKLFIIGNGFDLAHGLKTRYEDFLLWYLKEKYLRADSSDPDVDELCTIKVNSLLNYQGANKPNMSNVENLKDFFENLKKSDFELECTSDFFEEIISNSHRAWVNIENVFYHFLTEELKAIRDKKAGIRKLKKLNKDLVFLRDKLIEYIKSNCDVSNIKGNLSEYHNILSKRNIIKKKKSKTKESESFRLGETSNLFLNFNYTNLLKLYFESIDKEDGRYKLIQIHGLAEKPETVVFGFGDELDDQYHEMEKLNNNEFFKHIKSFKYFQDQNYQDLMAFVDDDRFEVIVLGHSLGLSDRTMLSQIFEHDNLESVQIYYYENGNDFTEKTYEISRHFSDKGRMRLKVVNFEDSDRMPQIKLEKTN